MLWKNPKWWHSLIQVAVYAAADIAGNGISTLVYDY
jgi:hypothetical protein